MPKKISYFLFFLICHSLITSHAFANLDEMVPVSFKGRFRPSEAYARLWFYDFYHAETLPEKLELGKSPLALIWSLHFLGHSFWDDKPLFFIGNSELKKNLNLNLNERHFSYKILAKAIYQDKITNFNFLRPLILHYFSKDYLDSGQRYRSDKIELRELSHGLWVIFRDKSLKIAGLPQGALWEFFKIGDTIADNYEPTDVEVGLRPLAESSISLLNLLQNFNQFSQEDPTEKLVAEAIEQWQIMGLDHKEIAMNAEQQFPLKTHLNNLDTLLHLLPSKQGEGRWLPIKALKVKTYNPKKRRLEYVSNFTMYPDPLFAKIRETYFELENAHKNLANEPSNLTWKQKKDQLTDTLSSLLLEGYQQLSGLPYLEVLGKKLTYPTLNQIKAEKIYYSYPFNIWIILGYGSALLCLILSFFIFRKLWYGIGFTFLTFAFVVHTTVLILRTYILGRPPVSNMFETVVYVPWITMIASFILFYLSRNRILLLGGSLVACVLLTILEATHLQSGLENVQAVLDSQYWLTIHVLMVVGSYGAFLLSGILGHFYLIISAIQKKECANTQFLAKCILQSMYLGLTMLVPGTILGGVWAAQSWGRFWDWDPKESWAFISICVYLIFVHSYTYRYVKDFGLAVGSVAGLLAISFTWYGVNYILGTGLHSYGFGSGGEIYYYAFFLTELLFLTLVAFQHRAKALGTINHRVSEIRENGNEIRRMD